ncbi:hypothetical protein JKP88DRAFT_312449 [Tribonema minus]|uniref:Sulfotransferase n=1 Tax=Tribonema minus TaxID=303371 RepID=A0A835Z112_9STRA|nr:hypothetical protein JKP88DRAFT_312449 [Tribonema minus]
MLIAGLRCFLSMTVVVVLVIYAPTALVLFQTQQDPALLSSVSEHVSEHVDLERDNSTMTMMQRLETTATTEQATTQHQVATADVVVHQNDTAAVVVDDEQPQYATVMIVGHGRSGSTFAGSLFNSSEWAYFFEPLKVLAYPGAAELFDERVKQRKPTSCRRDPLQVRHEVRCPVADMLTLLEVSRCGSSSGGGALPRRVARLELAGAHGDALLRQLLPPAAGAAAAPLGGSGGGGGGGGDGGSSGGGSGGGGTGSGGGGMPCDRLTRAGGVAVKTIRMNGRLAEFMEVASALGGSISGGARVDLWIHLLRDPRAVLASRLGLTWGKPADRGYKATYRWAEELCALTAKDLAADAQLQSMSRIPAHKRHHCPRSDLSYLLPDYYSLIAFIIKARGPPPPPAPPPPRPHNAQPAYMLVKYEDLAVHVEDTVTAIFSRLGRPVPAETLARARRNDALTRGAATAEERARAYRAAQAHPYAATPRDATRHLERWRGVLYKVEVEAVEAGCRELLRLHYPPPAEAAAAAPAEEVRSGGG